MASSSPARRILPAIPALLGGCLVAAPLAGDAPARQSPDIVFVLLDDLRWDALSCAGHPYVRTPNIDRLREQGAMMQNAFVTTSICCPSRASFLTGTFANRHGVVDNETSEYNPDVTPPLTRYLGEAGYSTAMIGKWHMGNDGAPRPHFDTWISFDGQGVYNDPVLWVGGEKRQFTGYTTDILTDEAIGFVERQPADRPYFLMLSHKAVHEPFQPAERHRDAWGADTMTPRPASWDSDFSGKPLWQRRAEFSDYRWSWRTRTMEEQVVPERLAVPAWKPTSKYVDQYRTLAAVDEGIGRLVEAVRKRGNLENTLFVFTSDNGYFHLEHRRWDKRLALEESLRIPMIVSFPGRIAPGSTVPQLVMNVDFAPTVLEYAGLPVPGQMQGRSMKPILEGQPAAWREAVFYEYWPELVHSIPTMIAVRTDRHKLIRYPEIDDIDELYDIVADPHELTNLAVTPGNEELHARMRALLDQQAAEAGWRPSVFPHNLPRYRAVQGALLDLAVEGDQVVDRSGSGRTWNQGNAVVADGALVFSSEGPGLRVPHAPAIDPSSWPYRLELEVRADSDGVVAMQAGGNSGFKVFVQDGRPGLALMSKTWITSTTTIDAPTASLGEWITLRAEIDFNRARFFVDGRLIDSVPLPLPFKAPTRNPLVIGSATPAVVQEGTPTNAFAGAIRRVTLTRAIGEG